MKLYKTTAVIDGKETSKWSGTQVDARADRVQWKEYKPKTTEVDVPTHKPGLLSFLNKVAV